MINLMLKKLENISMEKGRFFSDKSYKYDTIFFITKYLYEYISGNKIIIDSTAQEKIIEKLVKAFTLPADQIDSNKNYLLETLGFLCYTGALEKESSTEYKVCDISQLDFITVSIENAYIYQYLVAYKTFVNDNLWSLYLQYLNTKVKSEKEELLQQIKRLMCHLSPSIGDPNSVWASNMVKFPIMVLGLANADNVITRTLNVKDEIIEPKDLCANVEGTRSSSVKDNFYLHDFRINYVKNFLSGTKSNLIINKLVVDESKRIKGSRNIILYGVPGTGKTYATAEYAVAIIENRDIKDEDREELMKKYKQFQKDGKIAFTTFHQSYGYEDFIQGLRPENHDGVMEFKPVDGVFKKIADRALNDNESNYVIIIDEINRANMSKVLGELITLIEEDKRWGEVNELSVTLPSGEVFVVPNNLYIIGTMNTADKSISIIDVALRRRFEFIEQPVDPNKVSDIKLREILNKINFKLKDETDSTDLLIGHAYFMNKTINDLDKLLNRAIIPLLYEYFFDNGKKVKSVVEEAIKETGYKVDSSPLGRIKVVKE